MRTTISESGDLHLLDDLSQIRHEEEERGDKRSATQLQTTAAPASSHNHCESADGNSSVLVRSFGSSETPD